jgi:hypothetical protein
MPVFRLLHTPHRTTRRTPQPYHSPARDQSLSFVMPRYEPTRAPRVCGPGPLHRECTCSTMGGPVLTSSVCDAVR